MASKIDPLLVEIFGQEALERLLADGVVFDHPVRPADAPQPTAYTCASGQCVAAKLLDYHYGDYKTPFPNADDVLDRCPGMTPERWDQYTWKDRALDRLNTLILRNDSGDLATREAVARHLAEDNMGAALEGGER